jgi:hypothetical protein
MEPGPIAAIGHVLGLTSTRANKFFAIQTESERALAHRYRRIAEAMCAAAVFCPSEHQEPSVAYTACQSRDVDLRGI